MNLNKPLEILFEDEYIIVCKKPAGTATQTKNARTPDMESLIKRHLYMSSKEKKEPYLAVIHRLDQPVSGILVFAKTPAAAKHLNTQLQAKGFGKHYKALLTQRPMEHLANVPLIHYLKKDGRTNTSCTCSKEDPLGKKSALTFEIISDPTSEEWGLFQHCAISDTNTVTMVHIVLGTGRHHQIRVQMAEIDCPIWGDSKYGSSPNKGTWEQIALCAYKLNFVHPITQTALTFSL